jgi:hypothetical protein
LPAGATLAPWLASRETRRHRAPIDDLFDYARARARRARRPARANEAEWTVTDDWPEDVPVTEAEIEVFEAWFGDLFDELFSTRN